MTNLNHMTAQLVFSVSPGQSVMLYLNSGQTPTGKLGEVTERTITLNGHTATEGKTPVTFILTAALVGFTRL